MENHVSARTRPGMRHLVTRAPRGAPITEAVVREAVARFRADGGQITRLPPEFAPTSRYWLVNACGIAGMGTPGTGMHLVEEL